VKKVKVRLAHGQGLGQHAGANRAVAHTAADFQAVITRSQTGRHQEHQLRRTVFTNNADLSGVTVDKEDTLVGIAGVKLEPVAGQLGYAAGYDQAVEFIAVQVGVIQRAGQAFAAFCFCTWGCLAVVVAP
jgi:hypothetical protein